MKNEFKTKMVNSFIWFTWFTLFAFIVGIATKIVVIVISTRGIIDIQNAKEFLSSDDYEEQLWNSVGILGLQGLIILATLIIYPITLISQYKVIKNKVEFTMKVYRRYKKEFIIFLTIFIALDLTAIAMLLKAVFETGIEWNLDLIFAVVSVFIPTPLVLVQMIWLKKLKYLAK